MKKALLFLVALIATGMAFADSWQKPAYSGKYQSLTPGDTVYIYNTEAQLFLTEGNDWGTHATVGDTGLKFVVNTYADEGKEWDGKTYTIRDYSIEKGGWYNMFITDGGNIYVDLGSQEDYFFSFQDLGNNTYQILGAELNPTWKATEDMAGYVVGRYTEYVNTRDAVSTGTGVIYDNAGVDSNFEEGTFQTTWAFVSQADYAGYQQEIERYTAAQTLGEMIESAEKIGMTNIADEKAVYANTTSTLDTLKDAIASLNKKMLAYYEEYVTPDNPMLIYSDDCSSTDTWINGANTETFELAAMADWQNWEEGAYEGSYLNVWAASFNGKIYQTLSDLPNGIYVVGISALANKQVGAVYANENQKSVPADSYGRSYTITTNVTNGNLEFGYVLETGEENWITIDNVTVKYYGTGVDAYRYWLKELSESAPSFDNAAAQNALVTEFNQVLEKVKAANTEEDILAVIPEYEDILNRINLNIAAYETLRNTISDAEEMNLAEGINEYYGNLLSDAASAKQDIVEEHTLSTEDVEKATNELQAIVDEAQNYLWNMEKLASEIETAATIYAEYGTTCTTEAADAYNAYVEKYKNLETKDLNNETVLALLDELYTVEFNLSVPAEPASDDNPVDYTAKIYNPGFSGTDGWTNEGWATFENHASWIPQNQEGASSGDLNYLNLWNTSNASFSQTITGLPAGAYTISCGAFTDAEGFELFANDNTLTIEVGQNEAGEYVRLYTLSVIIGEEGTLTIGGRNIGGGTVWAMVDEYHLTYYGTESQIITGINAIDYSTNRKTEIYTLSGTRVSTLQKGINIVKKGGQVKKVLVK